MTGDTVECFNCGHENPSWAQVCRSCGYAIQPAAPVSTGPGGLFPTDQASLTSIGGTLGAILAAIALGLILSGLIPPAPNIAEQTPSPTPSASASASAAPSVAVSPSVVPSPALPATVIFGTSWDNNARKIVGETTTFTTASPGFAYAISLAAPIGVDRLESAVVRVEADGSETVVQTREQGVVLVDKTLLSDGLKLKYSMAQLYGSWGKGTHILRIYRGEELLGEGTFTFS
ncbi:MAG: zinc ribbon domain-containing protein [Chloroflexi bacterium]|nr:zinc ribbon domain-containing protein [Chloroflexota bacterium]